jgi:hypothetical protein
VSKQTALIEVAFDPDALKGDIGGLFGRMPPDPQRIVRKIMDAPNYDFAAMEMLDALEVEWRS